NTVPIIEADIAVNPAKSFTLDNQVATGYWTAEWGIDWTLLHELGHSWGLAHPFEVQDVWWDSVMNYANKEFRYPNLNADDAFAIRSTHPGSGFHDGLVSFYNTVDWAYPASSAFYQDADPNVQEVMQTGTFQLHSSFKIENTGIDNLVNPQVDVYLT